MVSPVSLVRMVRPDSLDSAGKRVAEDSMDGQACKVHQERLVLLDFQGEKV